MVFDPSRSDYSTDIAPARTFSLQEEAEAIWAAGLCRHLTVRDALVIGDNGPIENAFRFSDEPVRHKLLDVLGDLYLAGRPVQCRIVAHRSGHGLNRQMCQRLLRAMKAADLAESLVAGQAMDARAIAKVLPHRYPMLLVDRVIEMDAKTYSMGIKSWRHSGPAISVIQEDGVKRILGTVPIQPDGSVAFKVPAGKALHFQLLDERQRCIQIMRSFTGVMPGETRGCLGCHALHTATPDVHRGALALRGAPADLTPPPWGAGTSVSYERFCQPVLDRHCGQCHQGNGKARAKLDLTLRGGVEEKGIDDPKLWPFKEPYLTLVGAGAWAGPTPEGHGAALGLAGCLNVEVHHQYGPLKPLSMLSATSRLIDLVTNGKHHQVKVEGEDLQRLIAWVDCNCVYRGDEEVRQIPDPPPQVANRFPVPVKTRTAPVIDRLQPVSDKLR